ncbi:MAG: TraB/GumN family protein [Rhodobacteraceae bacterium]|nr:MAG: TraB/GumN family protein [Paracoccaceae bacterium]
MRILTLCLFLLLPHLAAAACDGTDLRARLSPEQAAALEAAEAATLYAHGNHWRARRGDRVIHVIGTIHMPDPRLDPVVARLEPVIAGADLLFLEATEDDTKALQKRLTGPDSLLLLKDTSLPDLMDEADWQTLAEAARARGIPPFMAAKMQPWYLSLVLALPGCAMELVAEGKGLDSRIEGLAKAAGVPSRSIEPIDTVFRVFNSDPLDAQLRLLQLGVFPEDLSADLLETTVNAYFDEAHSDAWQMSRLMTFAHLDLPEAEIEALLDDMEAKLLIARNLAWIDEIEAAEEASIVVAVGAAHLMGDSGVLNQLEQRGYVLERQPF